MSQELTIIKQENIQTIISAAPQSYNDNKLSMDKCVSAGQSILNAIIKNGMTDELDMQAALFIEKARKTITKMTDRRSPVTKLFDDIRKEFTSMENAIDPKKADTIPYKLQVYRNQYAAKKRTEDEARRRAELARQQAEQAMVKLKQDVENDLQSQFQRYLDACIEYLTQKDSSVTLENYDTVYKTIKEYPASLPADWLYNLHAVNITTSASVSELRKVELEAKERLAKQFTEMFANEMQDNKDYLIDRLPSKKANLERLAQTDAVEAARIKAEMEARQQAELAAKEDERKRKAEEEKQRAELSRQQAEMNSLFSAQAASVPEYQPKVKVSKKIDLLNPDGIMPIIAMWWSKEGCMLTSEELAKMFKKQITFCEKLAKDDGVYVESDSVRYVDDVKAK